MSTNKSGQVLTKLVVALLVPVFAVIALVKSFSSPAVDPAALTEEAIDNRIAPVAQYNTGAPALALGGAEKSAEPLTGEQVYQKLCMSCHEAGLAGAPKKGDSAAWAPRIAKGEETLFKHALEGFNAMPAKGGNPDLSDLEVERAVVFMANASGGKLAEPAAEGGAAPAEQKAAPAAEEKPAAPAAEEKPAATAPAAEAKPEQAAEKPAAPAGDAKVGETLANSKACLACHSVDNKVVGPAFKEVAAKYNGDVTHIANSIKNGSTGNWGPVPMAPNPVNDEEAANLAAWISSLK